MTTPKPSEKVARVGRPSCFVRFCAKTIPLAFDESLSYYEALCSMLSYLRDTVMPAVNDNAEALDELQKLFVELEKYVDEYFENLDVQEEINNKLDAMAEAGTLQEIIGSYLALKSLLVFSTVEEMKQSTNLIVGSSAKTLGFYEEGDNGGGVYTVVESGSGIDCVELDSGLVAKLVPGKTSVIANQFGLHADKTTDDSDVLQDVIDYAKARGLNVKIIGHVYVGSTINTKGVKLIGEGELTLGQLTYRSETRGNLGWKYLQNTAEGAEITFNEFVTDQLKNGTAIVSDVANPILKCDANDGKFNLECITVCGWIRNASQEGLLSTYPSDYQSYIYGGHKFKDISVLNCGSNAIHLQSLEVNTIDNIHLDVNMGAGLLVEGVAGHDTPFEYLMFTNSTFKGNGNGGVIAKDCFRKHVVFNNCEFTASGLYKQLNRVVPSTTNTIVSGIKIEGKESSSGSAARNGLTIEYCYGEECNLLVNLLLNDGVVTNSIEMHDNTVYPTVANNAYCVLFFNGYYTREFTYYGNKVNGQSQIITETPNANIIPLDVDNSFYTAFPTTTPTLRGQANVTVAADNSRRYGNLVVLDVVLNFTGSVAAYQDLIYDFAKPMFNAHLTCYKESGNNTSTAMVTLYQNNKATSPQSFANGDRLFITGSYYVTPLSDKQGNL